MSGIRRRTLLKRGLTCLAGAPLLYVPRSVGAATPAHGAAQHVLVLFARGGLRSHALFNAVGSFHHNPWGPGQRIDTDWTPGALVDGTDLETTLGVVPGFDQITADIAVLTSVDLAHNEERPEVDHETAVRLLATGSRTGRSGLLTLVGRDHPAYERGFGEDALPPVEIGATPFGEAGPEDAGARPLTIQGADRGFPALGTLDGRYRELRSVLDRPTEGRVAAAYAGRLASWAATRRRAETYASRLADPALDVLGTPTARGLGISNAELLSVLGVFALPSVGTSPRVMSWGPDVGRALRFLMAGSPMAVVTRNNYDLHQDEFTGLPVRASDLARQLAALHFLLPRLAHPLGGTFWDRTVVTLVSEFSRNNTLETGFNSANGSDHVEQGADPCRHQCVAFMGGPVRAGGRSIGATDDEMRPQGERFSMRSVMSTLLDLLGMTPAAYWPDPPISALFR